MKKILSITTLLVFSFNLHAQANLFSIVGKKIVSPLKDQVCQLSVNSGNEVCSGVRISKDYILTAEHCVRDSIKDKAKSVSVSCNDKNQKVEAIFESKEYAANKSTDLNHLDFALIKIKKPKDFTPKFKLLNNLAEYKSIFLNSSETEVNNFAENTYCEVHGYGLDENKVLDNYNSASISSTSIYKEVSYFMTVTSVGSQKAFVTSPHLPEKDKDWLHTSVRPGDSGGPMFCKSKSGEWVLSGIASVLNFNVCPNKFQEGKVKKECHSNVWGLPTKEALESITGVHFVD
jgi:secreted trypsin-like serine protease